MQEEQTGLQRRLDLVCGTISRQKAYITRVPDPDNRSRAETNLQTLVGMRNDLEIELGCGSHHRAAYERS